MSKTFKVGDVAIIQNLLYWPELNGQEVEILRELEERAWRCDKSGYEGFSLCYVVLWPNGEITAQKPHELRLKKPPRREQDEVVSWESVGWMPMDVKLDRAIKQALKDNVKERA